MFPLEKCLTKLRDTWHVVTTYPSPVVCQGDPSLQLRFLYACPAVDRVKSSCPPLNWGKISHQTSGEMFVNEVKAILKFGVV